MFVRKFCLGYASGSKAIPAACMVSLNSYLRTHFSLKVWPQRFARSVCLVTCRGIGKGQGVKVVNDSRLHERSGISKNDFQLNLGYMNVVELARMISN